MFRFVAVGLLAYVVGHGSLRGAAGPDSTAEFHAPKLAAMAATITNAIAVGKLPGGVLWLERRGASYHRAFGDRAKTPSREPMTEDTVFDAASLTKVIATTPAVLKLVEQGRVELDAPASRYLPEFTGAGKEAITVRQLLTHTSGLRPGLPLKDPWLGETNALALAAAEPLPDVPGTKFRYSDINFILLGLLVERVTGEPLDAFCARAVFAPLGMTNTGYRRFEPTAPLGLPAVNQLAQTSQSLVTPAATERIAPTEVITNGTATVVLRGVVHDPTARRLGGVAGHAGLFTTAADLARFSRMVLNGGSLDGVRVLEPATVKRMTSVQSPTGLPRRGLGWDIDSPYAGERGTVFPLGGFGHTGWTGTSLWLDPFSETFVILLSNRNHPSEDGNVLGLRHELGTLAAQAIRNFDFTHVAGALASEPARTNAAVSATPAASPATTNASVLNGIDVLVRDEFRQLRGLKVGLVTNQTGRDRAGRSTIDLLKAAPGVELVALFSPEHGIRGALDHEKIGDTTDEKTGLPIFSLYGERRAPTPAQLAGLDALMFDIQDIGTRFYTYISTMGNCLEAAAKAQKKFVVLDRVNPISGITEGPVATGERSFVAWHEIPLRHGMTAGELARLFNAERGFGADLTVIPVAGWTPEQWFDQTGLPWVNPSPNMRSLTAATLYPGVGLMEFCALSVGRGTATPFELLGAPYVDEARLAAELNQAGLAGVRFEPVRFTPSASVFSGQECRGVRLALTDRQAFRAADLGVVLATALHRLYPAPLQLEKMQRLLVNPAVFAAIKAGQQPTEIRNLWTADLKSFEERRRPHLMYPR